MTTTDVAPLAHRVFVYGTLMRGEMRGLDAFSRERAIFLGDALLADATLIAPHGAHFPALVRTKETARGEATSHVRGELWAIDDAALMSIDRIEGVTPEHAALRDGITMYARERVRVDLVKLTDDVRDFALVSLAHNGDGKVDAWTYVWVRSGWHTKPIGASWREHRARVVPSGGAR